MGKALHLAVLLIAMLKNSLLAALVTLFFDFGLPVTEINTKKV